MCPPDFFDVSYEINAWMSVARRPDPVRAQNQWFELHRLLTQTIKAQVALLNPSPNQPDMVFTANAGLVKDDIFIPSRFHHRERAGETSHYTRWFAEHDYRIYELPERMTGSFEGQGDALFYGNVLIAGHGFRSDLPPYAWISREFRKPIVPLHLIDSRWYHLDTCFVPLGPKLLAYYPGAFGGASNQKIAALPGEKIVLCEHDALRFAANALVLGQHVVLNSGCECFAEALEQHGYHVHSIDLSEFIKAGGSAKCLTLVLDA